MRGFAAVLCGLLVSLQAVQAASPAAKCIDEAEKALNDAEKHPEGRPVPFYLRGVVLTAIKQALKGKGLCL